MKRLIVNADDFGRTHGINTGVIEAHQRGIVTSATAMVNYEGIEEAARLSGQNPGLGVGLHVALTGGRSAMPAESVRTLLDAHGQQPAKPDGLKDVDPRELRAEVEAQFNRFVLVFGRRPTHLDSHHHSHRRPEVFDALCRLAVREGLPVRNAGGDMGEALRQRGVRRNDFFPEGFFDQGATLEELRSILEGLKEGTTELMCHLAHEDAELAASSSYASVRVRELAILCDPRVRAALEDAGISLINFAGL